LRIQEVFVTLLVTEANLIAATPCFQDMLVVKNVVKLIYLHFKLPTIIKANNKGSQDLIKMERWSKNMPYQYSVGIFIFGI
jgi:hypothetical protein